jgi:iron complex outermembrane receptor protein
MADSPVSIVRLKGVRRRAWGGLESHRPAGLVLAVLLAVSNAIDAEEATGVKSFDIPEQSLSHALTEFSRQAGVQIFYPTGPITGLRSQAIEGTLEPGNALEKLLAGSDLEVIHNDGQTIVLRSRDRSGERAPKSPVQTPSEADNDAASPLEEVIVRGEPRAGTLKRNDATVVNTITELEIKRLPNLDVSDVIARLPGVLRDDTQSGEDRYVQIRGLQNAAASESIDGVLLTDYLNSDRAASTELLPTFFVKSVTVTTTVTPDLDENSNAAHIAMAMISGLDNNGQRMLDVRAFVGHDSRSGGDSSTRQPLRLSGLWRGALDNEHHFGLTLGGEIDRLGSRQDAVSVTGYNSSSGINVPDGSLTNGQTYTRSQRMSALARLDVQLQPDRRLFAEYLYLNHDFQTDQRTASVIVAAPRASAITPTSGQFSSASATEGFNLGLMSLRDHLIQAGADLQIRDTRALSFRLGLTLNTAAKNSLSPGQFNTTAIALQAPVGYNISHSGLVLSPGASALLSQPDQYLWSGRSTVEDTISQDHNYFARIDYQSRMDLPGWGFKAGAQLKTLDRNNIQNGYARTLAPGQSLTLADVTARDRVSLLDPVSWNATQLPQLLNQRGIPVPDSSGLYTSDPANGFGQDFHANEEVEVAYGIASYGFDSGRVSAGFRAAHTHRKLDQYQPGPTGEWQTAHYEQNYTHVLPSLYGYLDLNSQMKVRAAFTQTLQRPPLASSAGNFTTSYDTPVTRRIRYSNPYLLPVRSTNFDTSAEYYFSTQDAYVSLGVFSRYLKDIPAVSSSESIGVDGVRQIISYTSNITQVEGKNVYGKDQGVEFTWSDPTLPLFPERLGNLGVTLGYDFIVYRLTAINGGNGIPATDTRLVDAGPRHYFNLSVFHNRGPYAINVFLQAVSSTPTMSYDSTSDRRTRYAPLLDAQLSYSVARNFRLLLEGRNLLDQSISDHYAPTGFGPAYQVRHDGRTLWLGAQVMLF